MAIKWRKYSGTTNSTETEVSDTNPLPISSSIIATRLDEATSTIAYVGKAAVGSLPSDAVWQIFRIDTSTSPQTIVQWADGNPEYDNVWNDRASLTYI